MTNTQKSTEKVEPNKSTEPQVEELSVKEIEDRLAFANAARCDIANSAE
jgi:hypothetical protein